jgi:predicted membrane protein
VSTSPHPPLSPFRGHRSGDPVRIFGLGRLVVGVAVLVVGVLFLLDSAGALDAGRNIGHWWPVVIVAAGLGQLAERPRSILEPVILIGAGGVLLLVTTGVVEGNIWSYIWPTVLIAVGLIAIARWATTNTLPKDIPSDDVEVASGIFGGPTVVNTSQTFQGASLTGIFGGVTLDLRGARPAPGGARISATAVFGGIEILVPRGWRISTRSTAIFGGVDKKTDDDGQLPTDAPLLSIDALALFGGVEVKHDEDHKGRD